MPNPPNPPATPEPPRLTVAFPFRAKDGKALVDEHTFYEWLADENTGNFAVSSSGMWHGGIHVSAEGAGRHLDLAHGVRSIAAGEVIAYRVNRAALDSQIAAEGDKPAQTGHYSSAFTLVRHTLEYPANNRLTFFSLYMHLQSVAEYEQKSMEPPAYWARAYEVTEHAADKPKANANIPTPAEHIGLNIHTEPGSPTMLGILPRGAQIRIGERRKKGLWGKIEAIESGDILPPEVASYVGEGADKGWVFLGKEYGKLLLKPIISQIQSDQVIVPATPIRINAGDLIGHLGQYWLPDHPEQEHRMVHIEVFCGNDLPDFLTTARAAARDIVDFNKLPLLRIDKGVKLFQVKKTNAQGQPVYEEGADAPQTAIVQIYNQGALDALPAENKGPKDAPNDSGQPWWLITSADSRRNDITGWVRNRQMPPNGGVTRESPHAWSDFETITGDDGGNPTMCRTVDGYLDYVLDEDEPATGDVNQLKPLACNFYRALSPMRNEARAADELRALKDNKWLRFRASRLMLKHRSEWACQSEYESFFETVLKRIDEEPYHEAEIERMKRLVWWKEVATKVSQPFPSSPEVFHIHPIALVGNFAAALSQRRRRDYNLGKLSSHYETGGKGPITVSGGQGDPGGVSYGSYQMTSKTRQPNGTFIIGGTVQKFVTSPDFPWIDEFTGLTPGTSAFTEKWKNLVNGNTESFTKVEHEFIRRTHFDILVAKVLQSTQVDIRYHSHALNDVTWSTSVHHGPTTDVIVKSIQSLGITPTETKQYDRLLIDQIYRERGKKNTEGKLIRFINSTTPIQNGITNRFISENEKALKELENELDYQ